VETHDGREVTIDLDDLDHAIEQPELIEELPAEFSGGGRRLLDRYRLVRLIGEGA